MNEFKHEGRAQLQLWLDQLGRGGEKVLAVWLVPEAEDVTVTVRSPERQIFSGKLYQLPATTELTVPETGEKVVLLRNCAEKNVLDSLEIVFCEGEKKSSLKMHKLFNGFSLRLCSGNWRMAIYDPPAAQ